MSRVFVSSGARYYCQELYLTCLSGGDISDSKINSEAKIVANKVQEAPSTSKANAGEASGEVNRVPKIVDVIPKVLEPKEGEKSEVVKSTIVVEVKSVQKVEKNDLAQVQKLELGEDKEDVDIKSKIRKSLVQVRELGQAQKSEAKPIRIDLEKTAPTGASSKDAEPVQKLESVKLVQTQAVKLLQVEEPAGSSNVKEVQLAQQEEDLEDYDCKTLKPQAKEWECHLCTLLNPLSSNICAVCATVRQKEVVVAIPAKKSLKKKAPQPQAGEASTSNSDQTYLQLVNLDNKDLVENREPFECVVCFTEIAPGDGVTLRECLHQFCKLCLAHTVEYTEDAEVKCPYRDDQYSCNIALQDREIKALVTPQVYEHYLAKSVTEAENKIGKSFHCKTPDCKGWCIFEDNVNEFRCPVCRRVNCLTCQVRGESVVIDLEFID
jgi:hypothetical protein